MKVYTYIYDLADFDAWGGAVDTKEKICRADKGEEFMNIMDDLYPDGIDETKLNDILAFEEEWCYELVGLNSYGVEPADAGEVCYYLGYHIESLIDDYNCENDTEFTSDDLNIGIYDFESDIEDWLVDNQEDETDEDSLAERWFEDQGRDLYYRLIRDSAPNIPEPDDHDHGDDC